MRESLKMNLISWSPLILLIGLLPGVEIMDKGLLLGLECVFLGFLGWRFGGELIEWNLRKKKEDRELWRKNLRVRLTMVCVMFLGCGGFLLVRYFVQVMRR